MDNYFFPSLELAFVVCCQEAQCELLLNKYQRFNFKPNVCQRLASILASQCVEQLNSKLHQKKHVAILFGNYISYSEPFKSLGATLLSCSLKLPIKKQNKT